MYVLLKPLVIAFLLFTVISNSFAQFPIEVFGGAPPKGNIDSIIAPTADGAKNIYIFNRKTQLVETYYYSYQLNPDFRTEFRDTTKIVSHYNKNGQLVEDILYYKKKPIAIKYSYLKTDSGLIRKQEKRYLENNELYGYNETFLSQSGKVIQQRDHPSQATSDRNYKYNEKGYLIEQAILGWNKIPTRKIFYDYDSDGNVETITRETWHGPIILNYVYTKYDQMQNWIEANVYNIEGDFLHTTSRRITYHK